MTEEVSNEFDLRQSNAEALDLASDSNTLSIPAGVFFNFIISSP